MKNGIRALEASLFRYHFYADASHEDVMKEKCTRKEMFQDLYKVAGGFVAGIVDGYAEVVSTAQSTAEREAARPPRPDYVLPPGALGKSEFLEKCTRCNDCLKACAPLAIRKAGPEFSAREDGIPIIVPQVNPCLFCEGYPCAAACKTGALIVPKETS